MQHLSLFGFRATRLPVVSAVSAFLLAAGAMSAKAQTPYVVSYNLGITAPNGDFGAPVNTLIPLQIHAIEESATITALDTFTGDLSGTFRIAGYDGTFPPPPSNSAPLAAPVIGPGITVSTQTLVNITMAPGDVQTVVADSDGMHPLQAIFGFAVRSTAFTATARATAGVELDDEDDPLPVYDDFATPVDHNFGIHPI